MRVLHGAYTFLAGIRSPPTTAAAAAAADMLSLSRCILGTTTVSAFSALTLSHEFSVLFFSVKIFVPSLRCSGATVKKGLHGVQRT